MIELRYDSRERKVKEGVKQVQGVSEDTSLSAGHSHVVALIALSIFGKKLPRTATLPQIVAFTVLDFYFLAGVAREKKCAERTLISCSSACSPILFD
jgi:hypothetical protein